MASNTASKFVSALSRGPAVSPYCLLKATTAPIALARRTPIALARPTRRPSPSQRHLLQRRFQHTIPRFTGRSPFYADAGNNEGEPASQAPGVSTSQTPDAAPKGDLAAAAEDGVTEAGDSAGKSRVQSQPHYQLTFTCVPCGERSQHVVSKQGYHHGSVLITCPDCRNRHVISDHLGIFGDRKVTVEDLMRDKGRLVKKGTLGEDGNVEFWEDEPPELPKA